MHITIILPVLYAYDTWSLALRENLRLASKGCILAQVWWNNRGLEKITYGGPSWFVLNKYYLGDQMREEEMGWTCGTYGGEGKYMQDFGEET